MTDSPEDWWRSLEEIIVLHLGDWGDRANNAQVDALCRACAPCESKLEVWSPEEERARIVRVLNLLNELRSVIDELHPKVFDGIRRQAVNELINGNYRAHTLLGFIDDADCILRPSLEAGIETASRGRQVRADFSWEAVSLLNECQIAWERRKKKSAPRSLNPASPFGRFVADVFECLGIGADPQSAMNAWRRLNMAE